jgi:hypothetical protein
VHLTGFVNKHRLVFLNKLKEIYLEFTQTALEKKLIFGMGAGEEKCDYG